MKKILFLTTFIFAMNFKANSQNLVPNPGFENYIQCPDYISEIDYATGWHTVNFTPDYYNVCNNTSTTNPGIVGVPHSVRGYQPARTGNAFAGIVIYYTSQTNYREVFQATLLQPLQAGVTYQVGMWVVLNEDNAQWAVDGGLGIYLSSAPINTNQLFSYTPQVQNPNGNVLNDSLNWTLISGTYVAAGGETYIAIGGFLPDNLLTIQNRGGSYNFTSYAIDDVYVQPNVSTGTNTLFHDFDVNVYPNPANDNVNVSISKAGVNEVSIDVFNVIGENVYSATANNFSGTGVNVSMTDFASGVYYFRIKVGDKIFNKKVVKN